MIIIYLLPRLGLNCLHLAHIITKNLFFYTHLILSVPFSLHFILLCSVSLFCEWAEKGNSTKKQVKPHSRIEYENTVTTEQLLAKAVFCSRVIKAGGKKDVNGSYKCHFCTVYCEMEVSSCLKLSLIIGLDYWFSALELIVFTDAESIR